MSTQDSAEIRKRPGVKPLAHIRVVDFTQFLSGPYATMILGDLGAEVIKVENPAGELARHLPPHFIGEDSLYFLAVNRNKRSLAIDLKTVEGVALARELIAKADVVIENFRPGVMQRLGFDEAEILRLHTHIVWCSISGFGQDGPARDLPAYDMIVQALSGGMSLTGERNGVSVRSGIPVGDLAAGMFSVIGVLAALIERGSTGRGRRVDVSMLDCQVSMLTYQAAYYLYSAVVPGRQGREHESIPTYRSFTAGDGRDVVVTANTEEMWRLLCTELGAPSLATDARFATNRDRFEHRQELAPILEHYFRTRDAADWLERLRAAGVPVAVVNTLDQALADPQIAHRNMVVELKDGADRSFRAAGDPVKFDMTQDRRHEYPPKLGQHSAQILRDTLGKSDEEIAHLLSRRVVLGPTEQPRRG